MTADIENAETWDMPVHFKVRQHASGSCWILIEQLTEPTLPILDEGFLGIDLAEGTTAEQAKQLAGLLDELVTHLTYTGPKRAAWIDNPGRGERAKRPKFLPSSEPEGRNRWNALLQILLDNHRTIIL